MEFDKDKPPKLAPIPKVKLFNPFKVPAGSESLQKTYYLTKYGVVAGLYIGVLDVGIYTRPKVLAEGLTRIVYHTSLYAAMAATYASVLSISGRIRKSDDQVNHFWAGFATGCIMGVRYKSQRVGWGWGLMLGTIAMMIKRGDMEGWCRHERQPRQHPLLLHTWSFGIKRPFEEGHIVDFPDR